MFPLGVILGCAQNSRNWPDFWGALAEIYRTPRDWFRDAAWLAEDAAAWTRRRIAAWRNKA
jgi:hypothetical protein